MSIWQKFWRGIRSVLFSHIFLIAVSMIIQVAFLIILSIELSKYFGIIQIILTALSFLVVLVLLNRQDNPAYKIAWILIILPFPIFGGLLYIILGNNRAGREFKKNLFYEEKETSISLAKLEGNALADEHPSARKIADYLCNVGNFPAFQKTHSKYYPLGELFFRDLIKDLKNAKKYIFIEFFIYQEGIMWDTIVAILKMKVKEGLDVKIIYDDIGSIFTLPAQYYKELEKAGISCLKFNPMRASLTLHLNNRDHRKIIVIDGDVAYTGGCNLADEYINSFEKHGHWKDTMLRIEGEAVYTFTALFIQMWQTSYPYEERMDLEKMKPKISEEIAENTADYIPFGENPVDNEDYGFSVYFSMITNAKKSVCITSPYFIVDNETLTAICVAAKSGIDIKIITPGVADKHIVYETTRSYYAQLIEAGVRVYEYTPGFMHSKSIIIDDLSAVIGTINFDYRSFYLHFENAIWLNEKETIMDMKEDFLASLSVSKEVTTQEIKEIGSIRQFLRGVLRVFAPFM